MKVGAMRPLTQIGIFLLFFFVPLFNIFRMDLIQLKFFVFGRSFGFNEGYILLLCVLLMVFIFVGISKWFGRQFCGWMCPHNTFSVYIAKITNSKTLKANPVLRKNIDIGLSILFAPVIAFSMVAYFFDPIVLIKEILSFEWRSWSFGAYMLLVVFFFIMIFRLRSNFCRNACPYGMFQMILSDKDSKAGGIKNMFRGTGLLLLIIVSSLLSLLAYSIFSSSGFAATIEKQLQGIPSGEFVTYTYILKIQNNQNETMNYDVKYEGLPPTWDIKVPEKIKVDPIRSHEETILFRIDKSSLNKSHNIKMVITSQDHHLIEKKLTIFPVMAK